MADNGKPWMEDLCTELRSVQAPKRMGGNANTLAPDVIRNFSVQNI